MEAQTYSVFQALGSRVSREALDLLLVLLESPAAVEELVERTGISSSTASRRLDDLALAGLVTRSRPRDPYAVACPDPTRRFLEAASELSIAVLTARLESEQELGRRVRKTRFRPQEDASRDKSRPA